MPDEFQKWSPWRPFPSGIFSATIFGVTSILFLILGFVIREPWYGVASLFLGLTAIYESIDAAFHAGMRTEAHAEQLRREYWRDAEL